MLLVVLGNFSTDQADHIALLHHFGSAKAVERASYEDLLRAPGINQNTAKLIYAYFHEEGGPS